MEAKELQNIIQAMIQASKNPISLEELWQVFKDHKEIEAIQVQEALEALLKGEDAVQELKQVAGGYRYHIKQQYVPWIRQMQGEEGVVESFPRAFLEVLGIIAYKQPVSRGEIEFIRGRQTSISVFEELLERQWVKVVGYGGESKRAMLYGTTVEFLEYFGLNSVHDLPAVEENIFTDIILISKK